MNKNDLTPFEQELLKNLNKKAMLMVKAEEYLSRSKYAEHRNVTKGYIGLLVKEGRLHLIKGKLNVEMSDAELERTNVKIQASNHSEIFTATGEVIKFEGFLKVYLEGTHDKALDYVTMEQLIEHAIK